MDYFFERTGKMINEAGELDFNDTQKDYIQRLMQLISDMAGMIDDTVDAIDELDMRLLEIEQQHQDK